MNTSSISGIGATSNLPYGAAKAAVIQLSQSHAKAFAADSIRVNTIAPGSIDFSRWRLAAAQSERSRCLF